MLNQYVFSIDYSHLSTNLIRGHDKFIILENIIQFYKNQYC